MKSIKALLIILLFNNFIFAGEYNVDKSKENIVKFISDAPIEEFSGITNSIDGYINLISFQDLSNNKIYFEVDLNTLDTGIGLRNRHMRDNYLETDKFQYTYFDGHFNSISKTSETEFSVAISGDISIHGVTKNITVLGTIFTNDEGLRIVSHFDVKLTDFEIDVPEMMFMKIDETMKLELDFNIQLME